MDIAVLKVKENIEIGFIAVVPNATRFQMLGHRAEGGTQGLNVVGCEGAGPVRKGHGEQR